MLGLLDFLGTIGGAILNLPGILGLALGMTTRNWALAAGMGAAVGLVTPLLLGGAHSTFVAVTVTEFSVSVGIGILAGLAGCAIRHKGASV